ncbi:MAG: Rieske 2Fe-2S domain-containing protein [Rhodospirillales bacterium]|nr:Rieske 2Fe-2S domain-containing protein [Rhodospirillales bacterium]
MTTANENEILTRVGAGTKMGELMRQFWLPVAKSSELVADGDPVRLKILGEKLIAFRDTSGRVGVMDHRCPHRCASLFFGRNEENGIRCVYHGWKFDVDGNCLDMANVPPTQDFKAKVKAKAYKAEERNGLIWIFMGVQENAPGLPDHEANLVPEEQMGINFQLRECNYLQAIEGELDTSHLGFLHFGSVGKGNFEGATFRSTVANRAPEYLTKETDYGAVYAAYRPAAEFEGKLNWRLAHFLFPCFALPPLAALDTNVALRGYVPIDDENTMCIILFKKDNRTAEDWRERNAIAGGDDFHNLPNTTDWNGRWRLKENRANDYLIDRDIQRGKSYTGIGGIILQDQAITESMGAITDHTFEHLAPSDKMITETRRRLIRAANAYAKDGTLPPCAANPAAFAGTRGGAFFTDEGADWLESYREIMAQAPIEARIAAE